MVLTGHWASDESTWRICLAVCCDSDSTRFFSQARYHSAANSSTVDSEESIGKQKRACSLCLLRKRSEGGHNSVHILQRQVELEQEQQSVDREIHDEQQRLERIDAQVKKLTDETDALKHK